MRYETPTFQIVGDATRLVLGVIPEGGPDTPGAEPSTNGNLLLGLDQ